MKKFITSLARFWSIVLFVISFLISGGLVFAATTVGTNLSTTGTFTQTVGSATAARFQNAAGTTTVLQVDTTNTRVGVNSGGAVDTTFEVGGTASISGIITLGGTGSTGGQFRPAVDGTTAFRFQNAAGTTILNIDTTNRRVGVGTVSPVTTFQVQGTASASYFLTGNTIQVGGFASVAYNRFGTVATTHSLSATNDVLVNGLFETDGNAFFDSKASISSNLQISGRFIADTSASNSFTGSLNVTKSFVVGATTASASAGFAYTAEFNNSVVGTPSFLFAGGRDSASTTGTCFQLKDSVGKWIYMRFYTGATAPTLSAIKCH